MGEHHHDHHEPVIGVTAGGWLLAAVFALIAVGMTEFVAEIHAPALALIGGVTFLVTAALCGKGGVELTLSRDEQGHGHDGHHHH